MKTHFPSIDQVNNLREIQALRRLMPHPNIVRLEEVRARTTACASAAPLFGSSPARAPSRRARRRTAAGAL